MWTSSIRSACCPYVLVDKKGTATRNLILCGIYSWKNTITFKVENTIFLKSLAIFICHYNKYLVPWMCSLMQFWIIWCFLMLIDIMQCSFSRINITDINLCQSDAYSDLMIVELRFVSELPHDWKKIFNKQVGCMWLNNNVNLIYS